MKGFKKMQYIEDEFTSDLKADFKEIIKTVKECTIKDILRGLFAFVMNSIIIIGICLI